MNAHVVPPIIGALIVAGTAVLIVRRLRTRSDRGRQKWVDALWAALGADVFGGLFIIAGTPEQARLPALVGVLIAAVAILIAILAMSLLQIRDRAAARRRDLVLGVPSQPRPVTFWAVFATVAVIAWFWLVLTAFPFVIFAVIDASRGGAVVPTVDQTMALLNAAALVALAVAAAVAGVRWKRRRRQIREHHILVDGIRSLVDNAYDDGRRAASRVSYDAGYDVGYYAGLEGLPPRDHNRDEKQG